MYALHPKLLTCTTSMPENLANQGENGTGRRHAEGEREREITRMRGVEAAKVWMAYTTTYSTHRACLLHTALYQQRLSMM